MSFVGYVGRMTGAAWLRVKLSWERRNSWGNEYFIQ